MKNDQNNRVRSGLAWSAIERFASQGVQFIVSIIIARMLMPSDYGVVAMAMILLVILQVINESGFGEALMQKLDRDDLDISTIFVFNLAIGVFLYSLVYFSAPLMSDFFQEPQLIFINRLLGLTLIINSFVVVQRTLLFIRVDMKTLAKASVTGAVVSGVVSITMAYKGFGVMALVAQSLTYNMVNVVIICFCVKFYPSLKFSYKRFKPLFNYTYKLMGSRLLNVIYTEGYPMIIGKCYSSTQLGFFNRSLSFQSISSRSITQIIQRVSTPLLCEAQNNKNELGQVLIRFIRLSMIFVLPISIGLFLLAEPLIITLLTEKWLYSAYILKMTSPIGVFYVFNTFNRNLFNATGRTDWAFQSELIKKIIFSLILFGTLFISFEALILGLIIIEFFDFVISAHYTKLQIGLTFWQQIKSVKDIFFASMIMTAVIIVTTFFINDSLLKLLTGSFAGFLSYFAICFYYNIQNVRILVKDLIFKLIKKIQ
ncbi:MAG: lipopolysaccharide biosynthesis protein [Acinetobacter sp.]